MEETTTTAEKPNAQPLKNPRHELFAQEIASGSTRTAAYMEVYPGSEKWKTAAVNVKASQLAARPEVRDRVAYLQERAADASVYTLAAHLARLNALSRAAEKAGDFAPAVKAEENRGKAAGFYPNRVELTGKGGGPIETKQTRDMTDEEFREACRKHGIEP